MFHGLLFFPTGFHKFICFEKTDVASMDWSCYFPFVSTALITGYVSESDLMAYWSYPRDVFVSTALITGYVSESDLMAYWSYPRDVALHEGFIALLFPCSLPRE